MSVITAREEIKGVLVCWYYICVEYSLLSYIELVIRLIGWIALNIHFDVDIYIYIYIYIVRTIFISLYAMKAIEVFYWW